MSKPKVNRTSRFRMTVITTLVLVAGSLTGIGFAAANQHTKTTIANATTMPVVAPAPSKAITSPNPVTISKAGASLTIKEWGMIISLPKTYDDVYYVPSNNSADPDGSVNTVWLGIKSKDTTTCTAALSNTGGQSLAAIVRVAPDYADPITGELFSKMHPTGVTIGDYYYGFTYPNDSHNKCGSAASRKAINEVLGNAVKQAKKTDTTSQEAN